MEPSKTADNARSPSPRPGEGEGSGGATLPGATAALAGPLVGRSRFQFGSGSIGHQRPQHQSPGSSSPGTPATAAQPGQLSSASDTPTAPQGRFILSVTPCLVEPPRPLPKPPPPDTKAPAAPPSVLLVDRDLSDPSNTITTKGTGHLIFRGALENLGQILVAVGPQLRAHGVQQVPVFPHGSHPEAWAVHDATQPRGRASVVTAHIEMVPSPMDENPGHTLSVFPAIEVLVPRRYTPRWECITITAGKKNPQKTVQVLTDQFFSVRDYKELLNTGEWDRRGHDPNRILLMPDPWDDRDAKTVAALNSVKAAVSTFYERQYGENPTHLPPISPAALHSHTFSVARLDRHEWQLAKGYLQHALTATALESRVVLTRGDLTNLLLQPFQNCLPSNLPLSQTYPWAGIGGQEPDPVLEALHYKHLTEDLKWAMEQAVCLVKAAQAKHLIPPMEELLLLAPLNPVARPWQWYPEEFFAKEIGLGKANLSADWCWGSTNIEILRPALVTFLAHIRTSHIVTTAGYLWSKTPTGREWEAVWLKAAELAYQQAWVTASFFLQAGGWEKPRGATYTEQWAPQAVTNQLLIECGAENTNWTAATLEAFRLLEWTPHPECTTYLSLEMRVAHLREPPPPPQLLPPPPPPPPRARSPQRGRSPDRHRRSPSRRHDGRSRQSKERRSRSRPDRSRSREDQPRRHRRPPRDDHPPADLRNRRHPSDDDSDHDRRPDSNGGRTRSSHRKSGKTAGGASAATSDPSPPVRPKHVSFLWASRPFSCLRAWLLLVSALVYSAFIPAALCTAGGAPPDIVPLAVHASLNTALPAISEGGRPRGDPPPPTGDGDDPVYNPCPLSDPDDLPPLIDSDDEDIIAPSASAAARAGGQKCPPRLNTPLTDFIEGIMPHGPDEPLPMAPGSYRTPHEWVIGSHSEYTSERRAKIEATVLELKHAFAYSMMPDQLPGYIGTEGPFRIDINPDLVTRACYQKQRPLSPLEESITDEKMAPLIESGIVVPVPPHVGSEFACNSVLAAKKDEHGNKTDRRFCQDFRAVNNCTPADRFYMKQPEHMSSAMVGCRWYSSLDLRSGYLQCPILEEHQHRTAFWYRGKRWMYRRSPFGLRNSGIHFSKIMATAIAEAGLEHCCDCWVDDVIIFSRDYESHIQHITAVLNMLLANGLRAHPAKSLFGAESVSFVGHVVSAAGLHPCPSKVEAIRQLQSPRSLKELQRAAGLMNFYRIYIPRYSIEARPIFDVMTPTVVWPDCWGDAQETAFRRLIDLLCQPGNALRRADPTRQYILLTDFSNQGIAGLLCQIDPETNAPYMVAAISRSLNVHERAYASYKGEMLSVVYCVRSFRVYLLGVRFIVITDHAPLVYLMTNQNLTGVYARWALMLSEYDMEIIHRPGADHEAPDCLSRDPLPSTEDHTGARMDLEPRPTADVTALASAVTLAAAHYFRPDRQLPHGISALVASAEFVSEADLPVYLSRISDATALMADGGGWIDSLDPSFDDDDSLSTLSTHDGMVATSLLTTTPMQPDHRLATLRRRATLWVNEAWDLLPRDINTSPHLSFDSSPADANHVRSAVTLEGSPVPGGALLLAMSPTGITLFEPFGGIAAGLEMCLRNGVRITRYIYSDISASARAIAIHRLHTLSAEYPRLLPLEAWSGAFSALPQEEKKGYLQSQVD